MKITGFLSQSMVIVKDKNAFDPDLDKNVYDKKNTLGIRWIRGIRANPGGRKPGILKNNILVLKRNGRMHLTPLPLTRLKVLNTNKQDIRVCFFSYSRPNGWTEWADIFCGHSGMAEGCFRL